MKLRIFLIAALLASLAVFAQQPPTVTVESRPWDAYEGSRIVQPRVGYPSLEACVEALVARGEYGKYACRNITDVQIAAPAAPPPEPPPPTPPAEPTEWVWCASENQRCEFSGTRQVRYGADGSHVVQTHTDGVMCGNATFGDPAPGKGKSCEVGDPASAPPPAPVPPPPQPPVTQPGMGAGIQHEGALPTGVAGSSIVQIRKTGEMPPAGEIGAFRTVCDYSHMAYDDPIVFPGQPGRSHLHAFFGNTLLTGNSTNESINGSGNSTCRGGIANRSGYWVPSVIDMRTKAAIKPRIVNVYYKRGYLVSLNQAIAAPPPGLRMIAGDPMNKTGPREHWARAWDHHCESRGMPGTAEIPTCKVGDELIMTIVFPQCWDGKNLDAPDHRSHMAYADGVCPKSHPVAIAEITFNVHYPVRSGDDTSQWRLASDVYDGPAGYSMHGDWWNGWDPAVAEQWTEGCVRRNRDCGSHMLGDGREIY